MSASPLVPRKTGSTPGCVIIAVDTSDRSQETFQWYMENLHKTDCKIIIAHCMPTPKVYGEADSHVYASMVAEVQEAADRLRTKYAQLMRERGMRASFVTTTANRADKWLVDLTKDEKAALIVLGCRGASKIKRAMLGSTSDYVLHHAKCPVAIYHNHVGTNKHGDRRGHADSVNTTPSGSRIDLSGSPTGSPAPNRQQSLLKAALTGSGSKLHKLKIDTDSSGDER